MEWEGELIIFKMKFTPYFDGEVDDWFLQVMMGWMGPNSTWRQRAWRGQDWPGIDIGGLCSETGMFGLV